MLTCMCMSPELCHSYPSTLGHELIHHHLENGLFFRNQTKAEVGSVWKLRCNMRLSRNQLGCSLPSLFLLWLAFYFVVSLSFRSSLHQRFTTTPIGRRESCSGVNWSISARLKLVDGVACSSACQVVRGQF